MDLIITPYTLVNLVLITKPAGTKAPAAFTRMLLFKYGCLDGTSWQITVIAGNPQLEKLPVDVLKMHLQKEPGPNKGTYESYFFYQKTNRNENILP